MSVLALAEAAPNPFLFPWSQLAFLQMDSEKRRRMTAESILRAVAQWHGGAAMACRLLFA